jgi:hypothetical protein
MMAVGRISGPLLKDNLLRNGVNLAFETSLLYLDVVNSRIGINTTAPAYDLDVNGTARANNLYATTQANLATFTFSANTLSSTSNTINLTPSGVNPTVFSASINVGTLSISGNTVQAVGTNNDVNITPNGTGAINLNSNVLVSGNLHATGSITADGNIQLGDMPTDTISFTGEVNSDILPSVTNTYNLGSSALSWNSVYANSFNVANLTTTSANVTSIRTSGLNISGNTINALSSNTNINLTTSGTGGVVIGNIQIVNNNITNISSGAVTQFVETSLGYVKVSGTNGIVIPVGTTGNYPSSVETGMMRYNSDLQYVEIYNGATWDSVAGQSGGVTYNNATSISITNALLFG